MKNMMIHLFENDCEELIGVYANSTEQAYEILEDYFFSPKEIFEFMGTMTYAAADRRGIEIFD